MQKVLKLLAMVFVLLAGGIALADPDTGAGTGIGNGITQRP